MQPATKTKEESQQKLQKEYRAAIDTIVGLTELQISQPSAGVPSSIEDKLSQIYKNIFEHAKALDPKKDMNADDFIDLFKNLAEENTVDPALLYNCTQYLLSNERNDSNFVHEAGVFLTSLQAAAQYTISQQNPSGPPLPEKFEDINLKSLQSSINQHHLKENIKELAAAVGQYQTYLTTSLNTEKDPTKVAEINNKLGAMAGFREALSSTEKLDAWQKQNINTFQTKDPTEHKLLGNIAKALHKIGLEKVASFFESFSKGTQLRETIVANISKTKAAEATVEANQEPAKTQDTPKPRM